MKLNTRGFLTKCRHPLVPATGCLPLIWLLLCQVTPHRILHGSFLVGLTVLLCWGCILLPGKRRLMAGMLSAAFLCFAGVMLLPPSEGLALLIVPLLCIALLMVSLPFAGWPPERTMHEGWYIVAIATHVLAQIVIIFAEKSNTVSFGIMQTPLILSFLCCAVLTLLSMNRSSLGSAAHSRYTVPLLIRRQNAFLTLAMLAIGVLIAAIPTISQALATAWLWLKKGVSFLARLISRLLPGGTVSESGGGGPGGSADMGFSASAEPSVFALLMEKVMLAIALVVLAAALLVLARAIAKRLWQLIQRLWHTLGRYGASVGGDYEDEITDTRDPAEMDQESLRSLLRRFVPADEGDLSPTQQVRSRYRHLKRRHSDWPCASTARETLPGSAASLYEQARYGGRLLTKTEAEQFLKDTKKV